MAGDYKHVRTKNIISNSPAIYNQGVYTDGSWSTDFQSLSHSIESSMSNPQYQFWIDIGSSQFAYDSARKAFDAVFDAYNKHPNYNRKVFKCILRPNGAVAAYAWPKCFVVDYQTTNHDSHIFAIFKTKEKLINSQLGAEIF